MRGFYGPLRAIGRRRPGRGAGRMARWASPAVGGSRRRAVATSSTPVFTQIVSLIVIEWPSGRTTRPRCVRGVPPGLGSWRCGVRRGALRTLREPADVLGERANSLRDRSRVLGDRLNVLGERPSVLGDPLGDFSRPARVLGRSPGVFCGAPGVFGRPVTSSHRASRGLMRVSFDPERVCRTAERSSEDSGSASRGAERSSFDSGRASELSRRMSEDTETTDRDSGLDVSKSSDARGSPRASVRGLVADVRGLRGVVWGLDASIPKHSRDLRRNRDARASPTASVRATRERRSRSRASRAPHLRRGRRSPGREVMRQVLDVQGVARSRSVGPKQRASSLPRWIRSASRFPSSNPSAQRKLQTDSPSTVMGSSGRGRQQFEHVLAGSGT